MSAGVLGPDPDRDDEGMNRLLRRVHTQAEQRDTLTPRECEVLQAFAFGLGRRGVASVLGIAETTVDRRLVSARRALRAKNKPHAVAEALRRGLIR